MESTLAEPGLRTTFTQAPSTFSSLPTSVIYDPTPSPFGAGSASILTATNVPVVQTQTINSQSLATTTAQVPSSSTHQGLTGAKIAAILVPILVTFAILPLLYLWYLNRRNKQSDGDAQEQNFPSDSRLLQPHSSRHNSVTFPSPLVEPFFDSERSRTDSVGMFDRPMSQSPRFPSFILPSNSPARIQDSWPLTSAILPDPPPAYDPEPTTLRPPSLVHGRASTRTQSSDVGGFAASNGLRMPFNHSRASDAVSELSFERTSIAERPREADELSIVSALDEEDAEKGPQHLA
ncbi:MAG: hypothetical protein MMC33_002078 [Icmadophila ericetorum]|nr:hypothetical protein [Icmadophila ericetorum]